MTDGTTTEVAVLRAQLSTLEQRLAQLESGTQRFSGIDPEESMGRRTMFKRVGLVAAGVAGASLLATRPAAASTNANGSALTFGGIGVGTNYNKLFHRYRRTT